MTRKAEPQDWVLAKLIKNPSSDAIICEKLRPWHFDNEGKRIYERLISGIDEVPKRDKNYEIMLDENGNVITERVFTATLANTLDSDFANSEYFRFLTSLNEPTKKELELAVLALKAEGHIK